jgi:hypothetical protein
MPRFARRSIAWQDATQDTAIFVEKVTAAGAKSFSMYFDDKECPPHYRSAQGGFDSVDIGRESSALVGHEDARNIAGPAIISSDRHTGNFDATARTARWAESSFSQAAAASCSSALSPGCRQPWRRPALRRPPRLLPFRLGDLNVGDVQQFADVIAKQRESGTVFRNITAEGIVKTLLALQFARCR